MTSKNLPPKLRPKREKVSSKPRRVELPKVDIQSIKSAARVNQEELAHHELMMHLRTGNLKMLSYKIDIALRYIAFIAIVSLIGYWVHNILGVISAAAQGRSDLSDSVLITLLTTTTANIVGFGIIIARYLFPSNKRKR